MINRIKHSRYWKHSWIFIIIVGLACFVGVGCSDDDNPVNGDTKLNPPEGLFGVPASLDKDDNIDMLLMWVTPETGINPVGYNIYRSLGGGSFSQINESVVTASSFGPLGHDYPDALYFTDTTYDTTSTQVHKYYVVSVGNNDVSESSDTVSCIPNTISMNNRIEGIIPADEARDIDRAPSFEWTFKDSANSYMVFLIDGNDFYPLWLHRASDREFTFKTIPGITYVDNTGDSLESLHEYNWLVWAISNTNCGFAHSEGSFTITYSTVVTTIVSEMLSAGSHTICWDSHVPEGTYAFHLVAGTFHDLSHVFEIADDAEHVGTECDPPVTIPSFPFLYKTGDIIPISFMLAESDTVRVDIVQ